MCHPKGRQPLGTFKVSEEKCNPNMECYCYRYNQGKVLLNSITVQTKVGCTDGCSKEGVVVSLRGERSLHYPKGLPCSTRLLDHASTIDFDGTNRKTIFDGKLNGTENFEEEAMLGDCYQVISLIKNVSLTLFSGPIECRSSWWKSGVGGQRRLATCERLCRLAEL